MYIIVFIIFIIALLILSLLVYLNRSHKRLLREINELREPYDVEDFVNYFEESGIHPDFVRLVHREILLNLGMNDFSVYPEDTLQSLGIEEDQMHVILMSVCQQLQLPYVTSDELTTYVNTYGDVERINDLVEFLYYTKLLPLTVTDNNLSA